MGFFSKIGKSLKRAFKSIGKGIKGAAKSVGKFMDKAGIIGQIGLALILPGIGAYLGKAAGLMAGMGNPLVSGIGKVLQGVGKFAATAGNAFKTVTDGVMSFVGNVGKGMINKVGTLLGKESLLIPSGPANVTEGFSSWMKGVAEDASNITSPYRTAAADVTKEFVEGPYQKGVDNVFNGGFEDAIPDIEKDFTAGFKIPEVRPVGTDGPLLDEIGPEFLKKIADTEAKETTSFLQKAANYGTELAKKTGDTFSDQFASNAAVGLTQRAGILPVPETNINSVTNVIPQFQHDSTAINNIYNSAGVNYGGTLDNRIMFHAADSYYNRQVA